MKKYYYRCRLTPKAPLRIGTGFGDVTDSDVMKDSRDLPFIPGTSLAGVIRSHLSNEDAKLLFGDVATDGSGKMQESKVLVTDATLEKNASFADFRVIPRDGVGLNDFGTTKDGAKFDFEAVELKKELVAMIELADNITDEDRVKLENVLCDMEENGVSFGARTTRGYGRTEAAISRRVFSLPEEFSQWLSFDPFATDQGGWIALDKRGTTKPEHIAIEAELFFDESFTVRKYTSELPKDGKTAPDYSPLSNIDDKPVIPGTSWAGSFRHHMRSLIRETAPDKDTADKKLAELNNLFGVPNGKDDKKRKSLIHFSETVVSGARKYAVTRIAVDRFTNAPRNQGLFTSNVAWRGKGNLAIELPADTDAAQLRLLAAALNDLNLGLLTVGGEGNIGRGICKITSLKVNGENITDAVRPESLRTDYLLKGGDAS